MTTERPVLSVSDWQICVTFSYRFVAKNAGFVCGSVFLLVEKTLSGFVTLATLLWLSVNEIIFFNWN